MKDDVKTKEQLIRELVEKRQLIAELERSGIKHSKIEDALRDSEARYRALFDRTLYCVYIHDFDGRFLDFNDAALKLLGYAREEIPFLNLSSILDKEQLLKALKIIETIKRTGSQKGATEYRFRRKDGNYVWVETEASIIYRDGKPYAIQGIARDITERKGMEEELRALSLVDELTGLYNRRGFLTLARLQLKLADRLKRRMFMFFTDVDGLKEINDTLGHPEGDQALIDTANILKKTFRESDVIARIGGDEFVVLIMETSDESAEKLTKRFKENLKTHDSKGGRSYKLSISLGTAHFDPKNPCSVEELMARADKSMYEQKRFKQRS